MDHSFTKLYVLLKLAMKTAVTASLHSTTERPGTLPHGAGGAAAAWTRAPSLTVFCGGATCSSLVFCHHCLHVRGTHASLGMLGQRRTYGAGRCRQMQTHNVCDVDSEH